MSIEDGFCTLAELADGMAAAVVTKYARPPGEVFTWQDSDGELDSMDTSENIRIVSRQNAVLEIFRLIDQGEITPLNMSFMQAAQPVPYEYFDRRVIRREQAAQILQRMFGTTPAPQPQAAAPEPQHHPKTPPEWIELARKRAREIIDRQAGKDLFPSLDDVADEIARAFRADGVHGAAGKPLTGAYIKRHALQGTGISSAKGRQLSTAPRRGK